MAVHTSPVHFDTSAPITPARYLLRRIATATLVIALLAALGYAFIGVLSAGSTPPVAGRSITVYTGDTLWSIAEREVPNTMDIREYIWQIEQLNNIDASLTPGQRLILPKLPK